MTMCAAYAYPIEERVREEYNKEKNGTKKHPQKINKTNALAALSDMLVPIFIRKKLNRFLKHFDQIVYETREIIRPDRKFQRKKKPKRQYHMNYKPL
jgi:hypothetical protein